MGLAPARSKRRSKPSLRSRLRTFWVLGAFVLFALVYLGWLVVQAPLFRSQGLQITGNQRVPRAEIVARAQFDPHANVWLLDTHALERRVEAIPYIAHAHLARRLPAVTRLEISERAPAGCVRGDGFDVTIDASGRVLEEGCSGGPSFILRALTNEPAPGAFLTDPGLAQLQRDARQLAADGRHLSDFSLDSFGQLEATLPDGIRLRFGADDDLGRKERLIDPILAALGPRVATVSAIDLRAPGTPVVEHRTTPKRSGRDLSTPN
jgi:cell division septal protein FtsQ